MISTFVTKPLGWHFISHDEWEADRKDWLPRPQDEDWEVVVDLLDWSEYRLLAGVAKHPDEHPEPSPNAAVWAYRNGPGLGPLEAIRDHLDGVAGLVQGGQLIRGPEPTDLGGYEGCSATYSYLHERNKRSSFQALQEMVALQIGEQMILACFQVPVDSVTEQDRRALMEIRGSLQFKVESDGLLGPSS